MCQETSKAMRRRMCETAEGKFDWDKIFRGNGIDVGPGDDPLRIPNTRLFDVQDGDANHLSRYVPVASLDFIHASQCLEHMHSPMAALMDWSLCLKPGGHMVWTVPDFDTYEKCQWPSRFNPDHKSAWSMWRKGAPNCNVVMHVPEFLKNLSMHGLETILARYVDTNFNWTLGPEVDQTFPPDGAECFIEVVLKKTK